MKSNLTKKLGNRIREIRLANNLKQCELADELNMERSNLTRIESGYQRPSDANLEKIAKIFNIEVKDLFDFEHLTTKTELADTVQKMICELNSKEIEFVYKFLINLKILKNGK